MDDSNDLFSGFGSSAPTPQSSDNDKVSKDVSRQSIAEYMSAMKKLFLHFQGKDESIADYTKAFKVLLDVAEQTGVTPGWYKATANIAFAAAGHNLADWDALKNRLNNMDKKKVKEFGKEGQK